MSGKVERKKTSGKTKYYALALFTGAYTFNHVDRQIIGVLIEPIRAEFAISDSQIGLLVGVFMLPYMIVALPLGYWADRGNRRNILAGCLVVWSGFTAACAMAKNFGQFLFLRGMVGAGESGCNPTSMSLISDFFPPEKRSSALGVYGIGTSLGSLIAFSIGGWVGGTYGWRAALVLVAIPGIILALLIVVTLKEPVRGVSEGCDAKPLDGASFVSTIGYMWSKKSIVFHIAAMICFVMAYASILTWLAAFFSRSHSWGTSRVGPVLGLIIGVVGASGSFLGGVLADRIILKGRRYVPMFLGLTYFAAAPFALFGFFALGPVTALICFAFWAFCGGLGTGPQFALLQDMLGVRRRGTGVAILSVLLNLFAFYGGPQLVGILSDMWSVTAGEGSLRYALACLCALYLVAAALCLGTSRVIDTEFVHEDDRN